MTANYVQAIYKTLSTVHVARIVRYLVIRHTRYFYVPALS